MNLFPNAIFRSNQLRVYLDGVELTGVIRANSELGEVEVFERCDAGKYVLMADGQGIATKLLMGTVRFGIKAQG